MDSDKNIINRNPIFRGNEPLMHVNGEILYYTSDNKNTSYYSAIKSGRFSSLLNNQLYAHSRDLSPYMEIKLF